MCAQEINHDLECEHGVPIAGRFSSVRRIIPPLIQIAKSIEGDRQRKLAIVGNAYVVTESGPVVDPFLLWSRQDHRLRFDEPTKRNLNRGCSFDNGTSTSATALRRAGVTAQDFLKRRIITNTDHLEDVLPLSGSDRQNVRCGDRQSQRSIMGRIEERETYSDGVCIVDPVARVEVLAGYNFYPRSKPVKPWTDQLRQLHIWGPPHKVFVLFELRHCQHYSVDRQSRFARRRNKHTVPLRPK